MSLEATRSRYDCLRVPQNGAEHGRSVFQCGCQLVFQTHISRVRLHLSQKGTDMVGLWVLACLRSSWAWEPGWQRQAGGPGACLPAASCPRALPASLLHCTSPLHASCQGSIHTHTGGETLLLSDYLRTYFEDLFTQTSNHRPSMSAVPQWLLLRFFTFLVIKLSTYQLSDSILKGGKYSFEINTLAKEIELPKCRSHPVSAGGGVGPLAVTRNWTGSSPVGATVRAGKGFRVPAPTHQHVLAHLPCTRHAPACTRRRGRRKRGGTGLVDDLDGSWDP